MFSNKKSKKEESSIKFMNKKTAIDTHLINFDFNRNKINISIMIFKYMHF